MDHTIPSHQQCVKFQESSQHIIALLWPSFPCFLTMESTEFRALPRSPRSEMSLFSQWNIWHRRWSDNDDGYDVDLMMHMIPRFLRRSCPGNAQCHMLTLLPLDQALCARWPEKKCDHVQQEELRLMIRQWYDSWPTKMEDGPTK